MRILIPIPVSPENISLPASASAFISIFSKVSLYTVHYIYVFKYPIDEWLDLSVFFFLIP